jgi:hypothetical protein
MPRELTPEQHDEITRLLSASEEPDVADRLTPWEISFIESIAKQFSDRGWLSPDKQIPKLKQIVEGSDDKTGRRSPKFGRPTKTSYGDATPVNRGGFSGFGRSDED